MDAGPARSSEQRIGVVVNPVKTPRARLEQVLERAAARLGGVEFRWYETTAEDPGRSQAQQALVDGAEVVIAAGGDGTVLAVAEVLAHGPVPLGLLPVGSGNLLARNLGLPLGLPQAAEIVLGRAARAIDLGMIEAVRDPGAPSERFPFLVMAGLGLDAEMIANTDPGLKRRFGWLAYIGGGLRSLPRLRNLQLHYRLAGAGERQLTVHSLLIGNCGLLPANVRLLPEAEVDDGVLDIVAMRPEGALGWLRLITAVLIRRGVGRSEHAARRIDTEEGAVRALRYLRGRAIAVRSEHPVAFEIDGDALGTVLELRAWVEPRALRVLVGAE